MATGLNKDVIRESEVSHDDRLINVTLGADQKVKMKLKGMKSGEVSIGILELYHQLCGCEGETSSEPSGSVTYTRKEGKKYEQPPKHIVTTVLNDLRSHNAISSLDMETMVKFEHIITTLLSTYKG